MCGAAVGVVLAQRIRRAPKAVRSRRPALPSNHPFPLALAIARIEEHRSIALAPVVSADAAPSRLTYETVPVEVRRRWRNPLAVAGIAAIVGGTGLMTFAFVTPHITALAAPGIAYPGTIAVISYAAAGYGELSYRLDARSGLRSGSLPAREGAFDVRIVQRDAGSDIVVVIRAASRFGSDARIARIRVLAPPRAPVVLVPSNDVHIDAFSVSAANVASGDTIVVRYRSNATSGEIQLRDARGGLWQSAPLNKTGAATLRVPAVERDAPFNVVLHAQRSGRAIENSLALVVTAPLARGPGTPTPSAAVTRDIPSVARSGATVATSAGAGRSDTVIELTDRDGTLLQRVSPGTDGTSELRMPVVTAPRSFLISVSHQSGAGRDSSFHWIRVLPAER